jgi:hypothetical protein
LVRIRGGAANDADGRESGSTLISKVRASNAAPQST